MPDPTPVELVGGTPSTAVVSPTFSARSAGELLVLSVAADDYRLTTGANRPESSGWTYVDGQQSNLGHYLWFKVCAGGETTVSYAIGSATRSAYGIVSLGTVMSASPAGAFSSNQSPVTASRGAWTTPAITPTSGDRWCVVAAISSTGNNTAGPYAWTGPYVRASQQYHTAGYRPGVTIGTLTLDGGTATSATATFLANNSDQAMGIIVAFKVAAGGAPSYPGTLTASVPLVTGSTTGTVTAPTYAGSLSGTTPLPTASITGTTTGPAYAGLLIASTPPVTGSIAGTYAAPSTAGTLNATTPRVTATMTGTVTPPTYAGTLAASTPRVTSSIIGTSTVPTYAGTLAATLPPTQATIVGTTTIPSGSGTLAATLPVVTATIVGATTVPTYTGTLTGTIARLTASIPGVAAGPAYVGTLAAVVPRVTGSLPGTAADPGNVGTLTAVLPRLRGSLTGVVVIPDLIELDVAASLRPRTVAASLQARAVTGTLVPRDVEAKVKP